jgi:CubicO group peptidase (beta-lactamase class C family)
MGLGGLEAALVATLDELIAARGLAGAQVSARVGAGDRVDVARGTCSDGTPMLASSRIPAFCLTKMLTAWAVLETCGAHAIDLETPAADLLPEFGRNGKRGIRLRHLLTNCAGIDESVVWPVMTKFGATAAEIYDAVCWAPLRAGWDPERRAYYDYTSAYTVLGVWLERVRGRAYREIVDELVSRLGIAPGIIPAPLTGVSPWAPRAWTPQNRLDAAAIERDSLAIAISGSPASGAVASAAELCALWCALADAADAGEAAPAIPGPIARRMRSSQRGRRFDEQFRLALDYGFGVMTSLADYQPWGLPAEFTARTFGHVGLGVALVAAVPERRLVYAVLLNGLEYPKTENLRMQRALAATVCEHAPLADDALAPV